MLQKIYRLTGSQLANLDAREILSKGGIAFGYRVLNMFLGYGLLWYITQKFGTYGTGIYNLCLAVLTILALLGSLGLNTAVVRFVSEYRSTDRTHLIRQLYNGSWKITLPVAGIIGLILFAGAPVVANSFYDDPGLVLPFRIIGAVIPFMVLLNINVEFIRGVKVISVSEFFRNSSLLIITLGGLLLTSFWFTENYGPVLFYVFGVVISCLFTLFFIRRIFGRLEKKTEEVNETTSFSMKHHLRIAFPMILTAFVQVFNGRIALIILGWYVSTEMVGIFGVAFKIAVITDFVISSLKVIAMPKISELFWNDKIVPLSKMIRLTTWIIFIVSLPLTIILLIWPEFILSFLGDGFTSGAMVSPDFRDHAVYKRFGRTGRRVHEYDR